MAGIWQALAQHRWRFLFAVGYLTAVIFGGAGGYAWIEGWSFIDSLYMASITVTSVGFGEVNHLSTSGRIFTMLLLCASMVGLGMWWAMLTALLVDVELGSLRRRRRIMKKIGDMRQHFIVCGAGRMGRAMVEELARMGVPYVLIDSNDSRVGDANDLDGAGVVMFGDATSDQTLITAGIMHCAGIAACISDDPNNLMVCLSARGLRPDVRIIARAVAKEAVSKLRQAGAAEVICPIRSGAARMVAGLMDGGSSTGPVDAILQPPTLPGFADLSRAVDDRG